MVVSGVVTEPDLRAPGTKVGVDSVPVDLALVAGDVRDGSDDLDAMMVDLLERSGWSMPHHDGYGTTGWAALICCRSEHRCSRTAVMNTPVHQRCGAHFGAYDKSELAALRPACQAKWQAADSGMMEGQDRPAGLVLALRHADRAPVSGGYPS